METFKIENKKKYVYRNNSDNEHEIIFECEAEDILEADKLYKEKMGNDPAKQNFVGCEIKDTKDAE